MQLRKLGRTDLEISPLSLGSNMFGGILDESTSIAILDAYVEAGGNCIDTADRYPGWISERKPGETEMILGRWMKARKNRDTLIIATKLGSHIGQGKQGLSRGYIFEAVETSLQHLQTDYIDIYQAHEDDTNTPLEETLQAFDELKRNGKARVIGASNYSAPRVAEALRISQEHGFARYECLEPLYNLAEREAYERDLEPLCLKNELGVTTYASLANGFLTGKYQPGLSLPQSVRAQFIQKQYMNDRGFALLAEIERIASRYHATPTQISLAWIMARPGVTAPIASATSVQQVHELLGAIELKLDEDTIIALNTASQWRIV
jgi:aryl-alcohol dehydrogenase-like predicted oxidoreductase